MKKLLGLLAVAPLSLAACGGAKDATPTTDKDTVVEIHDDKAHLFDVYKVQDYLATTTHVTPIIYYFIDVKTGVDLSDWEFEMVVETSSTVAKFRQYGLTQMTDEDDNNIDNHYYFGHDLNMQRNHEIELYASELAANAKGVDPAKVLAWHSDEDRNNAQQDELNKLPATATAAEKAALHNKYAYKDDQATPVTAEEFYVKLELHGTKGAGTTIITDLKTITA